MERTTIYLPSDLQASLRVLARRTGRSQAALVREAIEEYARRHNPPALRSLGLGETDMVQARDTEAWLDSHFRPR